ncbi:hypothetical protein [Archangium lansingense]|uniref:SRPBCC family protein n=1 Tax=Archangium lansingense TaxID=2995310 RepID=A0ABT4ACA8_9BACT|nr:hypothetical protein [Archangium lansinium]MCY1079295.1 hypothetical protein [Archangium lansinium]
MKRSPMTWMAGGVAAAGVGTLVYLRLLRPWLLRWGATDEEFARAMPGDELVKEPQYVTTRAITIQARPERIWPWLVQMGEGRGGFYSYVWIERLLGMRLENAERILPEFQQLKVGEPLAVEPQDDYVMQVKVLEPERALVLGGSTPPPWGEATWAMGLYPLDERTTRLVSRCRTRFNSKWDLLRILSFLDIGQFIMEHKWLLGVKERAERWAYA